MSCGNNWNPFNCYSNPNFSHFIKRYLENLENTVNLSDKLGYIYWFAVMTTLSCGCATGVYVTLTNRNAMVQSCQEKYEMYETFILRNQIYFTEVPWTIEENSTLFSHQTQNGHDEINELEMRINHFDKKIRWKWYKSGRISFQSKMMVLFQQEKLF